MKNAGHRQGYTIMVKLVCVLFSIVPLCLAVIEQRERSPDYDLLAEEFLRENRHAVPEDRDHDIPSTVESLVEVETEVTTPTELPPYWVALFNATFHEEIHDLPTTERSTTEEEQNINIEDDDETGVTEVTTDDTSVAEVTTDVTDETEVGTTDTETDASDTTTERTISVDVPVNVDAESAHVPLTVRVFLTIHNKSEPTTTMETTTVDYFPTAVVESETTTAESVENDTTTENDQDDMGTSTTTETILDDAVAYNGTVQINITEVLVNVTEVVNITEPELEHENSTAVTVVYNVTIAISANLTLVNASSVNVTDETLDDSVEKATTTEETATTETITEDTTLAQTEETTTTETVDATIFLIATTPQPYWEPTTSDPDESTVHPLKVFEQFVHLYSLIIFALALIFIVVLCCMYGACCSETGRVTTTREVRIDKNYPLDNMKDRSLKGADEPLLTQI